MDDCEDVTEKGLPIFYYLYDTREERDAGSTLSCWPQWSEECGPLHVSLAIREQDRWGLEPMPLGRLRGWPLESTTVVCAHDGVPSSNRDMLVAAVAGEQHEPLVVEDDQENKARVVTPRTVRSKRPTPVDEQ